MLNWIHKKHFMVRWGAVARHWPIERLLATSDLDLTPAQIAELTFGIHSWRQLIAYYFERFGTLNEGGQAYCFGVAHGSTVHGLVTGLRNRGLPVPHFHLFDSFEGLPAETPGIAVPAVWDLGAFAAPIEKLQAQLDELKMTADQYRIHKGWFSNTLKDELVADGSFKPAAYVDIDADLYQSTVDVLDFLLRHKIIRTGTLIGYDDWGDTELWTAGESRAHEEIMKKYGVKCAQLLSWGDRPLIRKLFLVVEAP